MKLIISCITLYSVSMTEWQLGAKLLIFVTRLCNYQQQTRQISVPAQKTQHVVGFFMQSLQGEEHNPEVLYIPKNCTQ